MNGMDLFEDGFPHSTKEGYEHGCRGGACPGKLDHGFSCAEAHTRYQGDYGFRRSVDAGLSPAAIAAAAVVPVVKPRRVDKIQTRVHEVPTVTVDASREPVLPVQPVSVPVRVVEPKPVPAASAPVLEGFPHGTARGYGKGCHTEACPTTPSCLEAHREYQRGYWERRKANGGKLGQARVKSEPKPQRARSVEVLEGLKAELVASKHRVEVLEAELAAARAELAPAGPGKHRAA